MSGALLPDDNSTAAERAIADVYDTRSRYSAKLAEVPWLLIDIDRIPEPFLPWEIVEEGLEEIAPFLPQREVLRQGRPWKSERGSASAIIRAMGWVGQTNVRIHYEPDEDERFDLFQVELSSPVRPEKLPDIENLIRLSKPSTDILARIFSGFDARPFRLDESIIDGPDLLDNWSGVQLEPGGPVISFGGVTGGYVELLPAIAVAMRHAHLVTRVETEEGFKLDVSRLDEEIMEPGVIDIMVVQTADSSALIGTKAAPWSASAWPGHAWPEFGIEIFGGDNGNHAE